jgi:hypothetical protein
MELSTISVTLGAEERRLNPFADRRRRVLMAECPAKASGKLARHSDAPRNNQHDGSVFIVRMSALKMPL